MRFSFVTALTVALAAEGTVASTWFGKTAYNKWHETELERWLSDHNVPYPTPADRKDLENLVKQNWNDKAVNSYNSWDTQQLQNYLSLKGQQAKKGTENNKDSLVSQVKAYWTDTEDSVSNAYGNVRDWIFDSWTDSQLKAFADRHSIPVPQPRNRDSLLKSVRENYQGAANKASETTAYPGNWLYESWTESDLKSWLDQRGVPVPQPSSRDKLIASVRRNSYIASRNSQSVLSSVSASASSATQSLSDALLDSWSDSQIKEWADKNGIKVPQGSKRNELIALARKHRESLYGAGSSASASATSAYGAATTKAGNDYAYATDGLAGYTNWIKQQLGLAASTASASANSATDAAGKSASSLTGRASKSASSASSSASKSASSASSAASKSAQKAADAASESARKASDRAKEEL